MPCGGFDGFDDYPGIDTAGVGVTSYWTRSNTFGGLFAGRIGGQCFGHDRAGTYRLTRSVPPTTEFSGFFAWKAFLRGSPPSPEIIAQLRNSSGAPCSTISYDFTNRDLILHVKEVEVARQPDTIRENTWYGISYVHKVHASEGVVEIRVNGEPIFQLANIDASFASGAQLITDMSFSFPQRSTTFLDDVRWDYDSLVPIPEGRSVQKLPNADISVQWTPLSGAANYLMLDEVTCDSDTTYVVSDTKGLVDIVGFAPLGFNPDEIHLVQASIACRKDDAATRVIGIELSNGESSYPLADVYTASDYAWYRRILGPSDFGAPEISLGLLDSLVMRYEDLGDGT